VPKSIVLDSNLIVSAILNPEGICALAIDLADTNFDMVRSKATTNELVEVLRRDKFDRFAAVEDRVFRVQTYIEATRLVTVNIVVTDCSDPKDNKFLELAIAANASVIVSGDKKHLVSMNPYKGIAIIRIRDFVDNLADYL
jgi:putative PIN family toxin of toxin-antitoxin system